MTDLRAFTQQQARLAETGEAVGQCPSCGAYTADGQPPVLHRDDCTAFAGEPGNREEWRP